jgi:MoxR-like ATPase
MVHEVQPVLSAAQLKTLRDQVRDIHVEEKLLRFITSLVSGTRTNKNIYLGASPRASIGILNGAKALAAMRGRDFVTPDDIIYVTPPVLRHRIVITPEKEMEGSSADTIIEQLIQGIEIPR